MTEEEYKVEVSLERLNSTSPNSVYAPVFPKTLDESWWLLVGEPSTGELLGLKRITFGKSTVTSLSVTPPDQKGRHSYAVYLMSGNYLGIDQQYFFDVDFV